MDSNDMSAEVGQPEGNAGVGTDEADGQSGGERARGADGRYQGQQQAAQPPAKRAFKVKTKTGGEEVLQLSDDEVGQRLSLHQESHARMREAAEQRKAIAAEKAALEAERREIKEALADPKRYLALVRKLSGDPEKAHQLQVLALKADLQERSLDPKDRELAELREREAERQRLEQEEQERTGREKADRELQARVEALRPQFIKTLSETLDLGGLPKDPATMAEMARAWADNKKLGIDLSPQELAECVKGRLDGQIDARLSDPSISDEKLLTLYPNLTKRVHKALVAQLQARRGGARAGPREPPAVGRRDDPTGVKPPLKPMSREEEKKIYGF